MSTFFYTIWLALPLFFFTLALWSKLEELSGMPKKDRPDDMIKQGVFVLICALAAIAIDYYLLDQAYKSFSPDWIPLSFYQLILLPLIFVVAGKFIGPTKDIMISRAPKPTQRKK